MGNYLTKTDKENESLRKGIG